MKLTRSLGIAAVCALVTAVSAGRARAEGGKPTSAKVEVGDEITMSLGEVRSIPAPDVKNWSLGGDAIYANFDSDGKKLIVSAKKIGTGSIVLISRKDDTERTIWVVVNAKPTEVVEREVR